MDKTARVDSRFEVELLRHQLKQVTALILFLNKVLAVEFGDQIIGSSFFTGLQNLLLR